MQSVGAAEMNSPALFHCVGSEAAGKWGAQQTVRGGEGTPGLTFVVCDLSLYAADLNWVFLFSSSRWRTKVTRLPTGMSGGVRFPTVGQRLFQQSWGISENL